LQWRTSVFTWHKRIREKISNIYHWQKPTTLDDIDRQARAVFGNSGSPLSHDDLETLPTEQVEYWLSDRSPHKPSAITRSAFSDPRIEAIQGQIREAETVQMVHFLSGVRCNFGPALTLFVIQAHSTANPAKNGPKTVHFAGACGFCSKSPL